MIIPHTEYLTDQNKDQVADALSPLKCLLTSREENSGHCLDIFRPQEDNIEDLCKVAILNRIIPDCPISSRPVLGKIISGESVAGEELETLAVSEEEALPKKGDSDQKWMEFEKSGDMTALLRHAAKTGHWDRLLSYILYAVSVMKIAPEWNEIRGESDAPFVNAVCDLFENNDCASMASLANSPPEAHTALYAWRKLRAPELADQSLLDSDDFVAGYFRYQNGVKSEEALARSCPLFPGYPGFQFSKFLNSMKVPRLPDSIGDIRQDELADAMSAYAYALCRNGDMKTWDDLYVLSKRTEDRKLIDENMVHAALRGAPSALRDWYQTALKQKNESLMKSIRGVMRELHGEELSIPEKTDKKESAKKQKQLEDSRDVENAMVEYIAGIRRRRPVFFLLGYLIAVVSAAFCLFYFGGQLCCFFDWIFGTRQQEYEGFKILLYALVGFLTLPWIFFFYWWRDLDLGSGVFDVTRNCEDWLRKQEQKRQWKNPVGIWREHRLVERLPERKTLWPNLSKNLANILYIAILCIMTIAWFWCFFIYNGPFLSALDLFVGTAALVFVKICRMIHNDLGEPLPEAASSTTKTRKNHFAQYAELVFRSDVCALPSSDVEPEIIDKKTMRPRKKKKGEEGNLLGDLSRLSGVNEKGDTGLPELSLPGLDKEDDTERPLKKRKDGFGDLSRLSGVNKKDDTELSELSLPGLDKEDDTEQPRKKRRDGFLSGVNKEDDTERPRKKRKDGFLSGINKENDTDLSER